MVKKGYFFTVDALIAIGVIILVMFLVPMFYVKEQESTQQEYVSRDIVRALSNLRIDEITDPNVRMFLNGTSGNRTVIEQILVYYVLGMNDTANNLINALLGDLVSDSFGFGIYTGDGSMVYSSGDQDYNQVITTKSMVSGVEENRAVEGLSSRVFLTGINDVVFSEYVFFGGYVGDGNITKVFELPHDANVVSAYLELDVNGGFDIYVNGEHSGYFSPGNVTEGVDRWTLDESNNSLFKSGNNTIEFRFKGENKYIGGGYFKVAYSSSEIEQTSEGYNRQMLPGIDGIINLYSSFYVPGILTGMNVSLHYLSQYGLFFSIGDIMVFDSDDKGEKNIFLTDSILSQVLDYSKFVNKTVPLRVGVLNSTFVRYAPASGADTILVTDVSGSMLGCGEYNSTLMCEYDCCVDEYCPDTYSCASDTCEDEECGACPEYGTTCEYKCCRDTIFGEWCPPDRDQSCVSETCVDEVCGDCGNDIIGRPFFPRYHVSYGGQSTASDYNSYLDTSCIRSKLEVAQDAAIGFVDVVLSIPSNKVGLVSYQSDVQDTHDLSNDSVSLDSEIEGYESNFWWGTCICCGINEGIDLFSSQSGEGRARFMLVMSDGEANDGCMEQPNSTAKADAVQAACDAFNLHNITVFSVGYGADVDTVTLSSIADCGRGKYYYTNVSDLSSIYKTIGEEFNNLTYQSQTLVSVENATLNNSLFEDSYIEFFYDEESVPLTYGIIPITIETAPFGNNISNGSFFVPLGVDVYDAKLVSYSGEKWTDKAYIADGSGGWHMFYNLSEYGKNYYQLGDPYMINIPRSIIRKGYGNEVRVSTGLGPENSTGGSPDNKVIYTIGVRINSTYGRVTGKAEGCIWEINFEDGTAEDVRIPSNYSGSETCQYLGSTSCEDDYSEDAVNLAVCQLFSQLDFDGDGELLVKMGQDDIQAEIVSLGKIPYMWGPTVMEVRVWT